MFKTQKSLTQHSDIVQIKEKNMIIQFIKSGSPPAIWGGFFLPGLPLNLYTAYSTPFVNSKACIHKGGLTLDLA